ncbi:hypothetical protein [Serratia sp. N21D137]|uniref:hypothetical protein n=1 Tax=Serratia sp. N21D137 TaxID=3397495 RepID=UPI0039DF7348
MDKQTESREAFKKWWNEPEQAELRLSCAEGWGFRIWTASRESIDLPISIEPSDTPSSVIYQIGGSGFGIDESISEGYSIGYNSAIRAIGIRIKGEGV